MDGNVSAGQGLVDQVTRTFAGKSADSILSMDRAMDPSDASFHVAPSELGQQSSVPISTPLEHIEALLQSIVLSDGDRFERSYDALRRMSLGEGPTAAAVANKLGFMIASDWFRVCSTATPSRLALCVRLTEAYGVLRRSCAPTQAAIATLDSYCLTSNRLQSSARPPVAREGSRVANTPDSPHDTDGALTTRELEVASLVAAGLTNKQVGHKLNLSPHTVKRHLARIAKRIGRNGRAALASWYATKARDG